MNVVYKLLFFFLIFIVTALAGYKVYVFFNNRIQSSRRGREVALYAILLFVICALLLFIASLALVYGYEWLKGSPDAVRETVPA
jgi:cation transporter-like permease